MNNDSGRGEAGAPGLGAVVARKYTLIEDLGPSDSGHDYVAEQTTLRKRVIATILDPELATNEVYAARILREARVLSLVRHDNVARLIDYGQTPDRGIYLIRELLEGSDLGSHQAGTKRFPWPRAKALILQVIAGLRAAAGKDIIHGGIRPSVVYITPGPGGAERVKLIGFGLMPASRIDLFSGEELIEVAEFAAPEQGEGKAADGRADIYSVGVLLYNLLTGSVPFTGKEPHQILTQHNIAPPPPPRNIAPDANIPPAVEALVLRCLAKKPDDRLPDLLTLEREVREIDDEGRSKKKGPPPRVSTAGGLAPASPLGDQPTRDSALFVSIEALQGMLASASDPDAQLGILDRMEKALAGLAGADPDSDEAVRWREWIRRARDYAYFQLGQRHLAAERWRDLEGVYRRRLELAPSEEDLLALKGALAGLYLNNLLSYEKAITLFRELVEAQPDSMESHLGLARALERHGDVEEAIPHYERFIELCPDATRGAEELAHLGDLLHNKMSDTDAAITRLFQATELVPGHLPALKLLAELFRARHEWLELAEVLETIVEHTPSNYEKIERATEAGFLWIDKLQVKDRAIPMFAKVVELDPENTKVGTILGKIYYENKNYVAAAPIFDALVRKIDNLGLRPTSQVGVLVRAAQVARAVGSLNKASKLYKRALELDPESSHALLGQAELAMTRGAWDEARVAYEKLLPRRKDDDKSAIHVKLAEIAIAQERPDIAINEFKAAIADGPKNLHAHDGLIAVYRERKDWRSLLKALQGKLPQLKGDAKADAFVEIGGLFRDRLGEPDRAIAAFQRAHELRPKDQTLLHTLLELQTAAKRWTDVMPILDELIAIEADPKRRAKYLYTSAALQRDEVGDEAAAIERFDLVLRDDPSFLKAFQAIDTLITKRKDWRALERAYRKMINRLPADDTSPLKQLLWHNLAEIYRSRLGDFRSAAKALEVAISLDPSNFQRQLMLSELYAMLMKEDPANFTESLIRSHNTLIRLDPSYYKSYHQIYNIYRMQSALDKAYCVARTLIFLKQATDEETRFYQSGPPAVFRQARGRLSDDVLRRYILPGDQDPTVTTLLGLVAPALASWRAKPPPPSLRGSEPIDTAESPSIAAQAHAYVCRVLGATQPALYFQPSEPGDLSLHIVRRRGGEIEQLAIAHGALLREREDGEVVFEVARVLANLYPPHQAFLLLELSPQNLKQLLVACSVLAERGANEGGQGVAAITGELASRLTPAALEQVKGLARQLSQTDVKVWARAAAIANYRLGLLLCNDLDAAAHAIAAEQRSSGQNINGKDALKELIVYSVSEAYFEARRSIGLAVG